jgi:TonB family protein
MNSFCTSCGARVLEGASTCGSCGEPLIPELGATVLDAPPQSNPTSPTSYDPPPPPQVPRFSDPTVVGGDATIPNPQVSESARWRPAPPTAVGVVQDPTVNFSGPSPQPQEAGSKRVVLGVVGGLGCLAVVVLAIGGVVYFLLSRTDGMVTTDNNANMIAARPSPEYSLLHSPSPQGEHRRTNTSAENASGANKSSKPVNAAGTYNSAKQTDGSEGNKSPPVSGGVLNGKAISLPKPVYPPLARAAHASGTVVVQVTLDEDGRVISAHAVSGHPLLQAAAVKAAFLARFSPAMLSGRPIKVTGVITYNFVAE